MDFKARTCTFVFLVFLVCVSVDGKVDAKNIFILAGQSNMVGRGSVYELIPERQPTPKILRFAADRKWEVAADPLHADIDTAPNTTAGVGPGMPFAKGILKSVPNFGLIGLVPCAVGDTSITEWSKGSPFPYYNNTVARALAAVEAGGGVIRGMLWYQGEKDTGGPQDAMAYKMKFQSFINDIRTDLQLPLLPIVEVALDYLYNGSDFINLVRKAQFETAVELQNVTCVDAKGLEISWDQIHLTTPAQVKLGGMMAEAFLNSFN